MILLDVCVCFFCAAGWSVNRDRFIRQVFETTEEKEETEFIYFRFVF